ncbi:hypothetical protein ES703_58455 [subsurface metagenome]
MALAIGLETDRGIICSTSPRRKHAIKNCSSLKENSVTWPEFSLFVVIEVSLRIDAIHRRVHRRPNNNHQ